MVAKYSKKSGMWLQFLISQKHEYFAVATGCLSVTTGLFILILNFLNSDVSFYYFVLLFIFILIFTYIAHVALSSARKASKLIKAILKNEIKIIKNIEEEWFNK